MDERSLAGVDAVVVLGCRLAPEAYAPAVLARRAETGARAFHASAARLVVASGGRRWDDRSEAEAIAAVLDEHGVPRSAVVRELCSLSTVENAWYSSALLREAGAGRVALVTCDWHMARALACFAAFGVHAEPVPARTPPAGAWRRARRSATERARRFVDERAAARWTRA